MTKPELIPIHIPRPVGTDIAIVAIDSQGNQAGIALTRQAIDHADPNAWKLIVKDLIAQVDDYR